MSGKGDQNTIRVSSCSGEVFMYHRILVTELHVMEQLEHSIGLPATLGIHIGN